jgi:hypothetical protein
MKAVEFIKVVRDDLRELYDLHELAVATDGKQGFLCLTPERLIEKMNRTDKEILELYLAEGAAIEDAAEYLASIK